MSKLPEETSASSDAESERAMRRAVEQRLAPDPAAERVPPTISDHTLLHRIGRGAYGEVWLARNALGTLRAVKIVYGSDFEDDHPYEREFKGILKYEPISRSHEGLVQVLHVGRDDERGCFYYVMELADAAGEISEPAIGKSAVRPAPLITGSLNTDYSPRTLRSDLKRRQRLPSADAARLTLRLAGALAHLHAQELVHRDIKPSNVIFVNGQPKLADIGLVAGAGDSRSFVGTEGFIPPEGPGSVQADIYSLGKLLYELATGRDRMDFPQLPPGVAQLADGEALLELNEVMTRACSPDAKARYASAAEFQADLNLFLAGRSLRRARNVERHLVQLKRVAVGACVLVLLAAAIVWLAKREERQARDRADEANRRAHIEATLRSRAETAERLTEQQLYTALLEQARATVRSGQAGHRFRALDALRRAAAISNSVELRREVFAALALPDVRFERTLPHGPEITFAQLDPKFERVALGRGAGAVEIRATADNHMLATLPAFTNRPAFNAQWSPDGRHLAVKRDRASGGRADWEVWEVNPARRVGVISNAVESAVDFHPREPIVAAGLPNRTVTVWNLASGQETARFQMTGTVYRLEFSAAGERFAAARQVRDGTLVSVHDATNGALLAAQLLPDFVSDLEWQPGGRALAVAGQSGQVTLLDAATGETATLGRHTAEAARAAFTPDGAYLFTSGWELEFICWDTRARRRVFAMPFDNRARLGLQFRADGRACALEGKDGVRLHEFVAPSGYQEFAEDLGGRINHAAFSSDGRWLAVSGGEQFGVWDMERGGSAARTDATSDTRFSFTRDGELLADRRGHCSRWRITAGTNGAAPTLENLPLPVPAGFVSLALLSNTVAVTATAGTALVGLDQLAAEPDGWKRTVDGLNCVSPDGKWLAVFRSYSPHLYIHRLPGMERVAKLTNSANIHRAYFSPGGGELAVASRAGVEFWSAATWQRTRVLTNFIGVLYGPDPRTLWLASDFRQAGLYRAGGTELLQPLPAGMMPLAVSPDGRRVAMSVEGRRVQVWNLPELRAQLRELGMDWVD